MSAIIDSDTSLHSLKKESTKNWNHFMDHLTTLQPNPNSFRLQPQELNQLPTLKQRKQEKSKTTRMR